LRLVLDPDNLIRESDEPTPGDFGQNNVKEIPVPDIAASDLTVRRLLDEYISFKWKITDLPDNTVTSVGLYWSDDEVFELPKDGIRQAYIRTIIIGGDVREYTDTVAISDLKGTPADYLLLVVDPFNDITTEPDWNNVRSIPFLPECYFGKIIDSVRLPGRSLDEVHIPLKDSFTLSVQEKLVDFEVISDYDPFSTVCTARARVFQWIVVETPASMPVPTPLVLSHPLWLPDTYTTITQRPGYVDWSSGYFTLGSVTDVLPGDEIPLLPKSATRSYGEFGLTSEPTITEVVEAAAPKFHGEFLEDSWVLSLADFVIFFDPGATDLLVTDEAGRRTGALPDGTVVQEIPLSFYVELEGQPLVYIASPEDGEYETQVIGRSPGEYEYVATFVQNSTIASQQSFSGTIVEGESVVYISTLDSGKLTTVERTNIDVTPETIVYFNHDAETEQNYTIDATGQRSMVRQIQVLFDGPVNVPLGPVTNNSFLLDNLDVLENVPLQVVGSEFIGDKQAVTLQPMMPHALVELSGSLVNGNYRLTVDADGDGTPDGQATDDFFRLFGDLNSNHRIDMSDCRGLFSYIRSGTDAAVFDYDNDGHRDRDDMWGFFHSLISSRRG